MQAGLLRRPRCCIVPRRQCAARRPGDGFGDEAMAETKQAQQLDPLSGIIGLNVGIVYLAKDDPNSGAAEFRRIVEFDPNWWGGHFYLGMAHLELGRPEGALSELQKSGELTNRTGRSIGLLGYGPRPSW